MKCDNPEVRALVLAIHAVMMGEAMVSDVPTKPDGSSPYMQLATWRTGPGNRKSWKDVLAETDEEQAYDAVMCMCADRLAEIRGERR